jgi:peptide-methionine (S)-S-oxide reductase
MAAGWKANGVIAFVVIVVLGAGYFIYRQGEVGSMTVPRKEISADCELATLGGGCFWCIEAAYEQVQGVERVESGYAGGSVKDPTYHEVCSGTTGHAEVIQVAFDPKVISYREIVQMFFVLHDPTTLNRQGNDVGTQYRSAIFYHSDAQKQTAEAVIKELTDDNSWGKKITTQVAPIDVFYRAEEYHQSFFRNNPRHGYCLATVPPKLAKLRKHFSSKLRSSSG